MGDIWLLGAMLLCSCIGYQSATRYGLSGITGVTVSLALCTVLGTELWDEFVYWLTNMSAGDLLANLGVAVAAASALFIVEKLKLYAFVKLVGLMIPISFTSVKAPEYAFPQYEAPTTEQKVTLVSPTANEGEQIIRRNLQSGQDGFFDYAARFFGEVTRAGREFEKLTRVSADTLLYQEHDGRLVRSSTVVRKGTWVISQEEVVDDVGQKWLKVSLRTVQGQKEGFIPMTKSAVEAPDDK